MKKIIIVFLIIAFCLGQLGRLSFFRPDLVIQVNDIVVGLTVMVYFLVKLIRKEKIIWPKFIQPAAVFLIIALISNLYNLKNYGLIDSLIGSLYLWRFLIYILLGIAVYNLKAKVVKLLIISGTITAIVGLLQYWFYPDLRPLADLNWDPHVFRVVGSFFDPGFIGAILVLSLILLATTKSFPKNKVVLAIFSLNYLVMLLTYSRSAYLMYLVSMLVIAVIKRSTKFYLLILMVFLISLAIIPKAKSYGTELDRQETVWARFENYQQALLIWRKNWLLGIGFNNYRYAQIKEGLTGEEQGIVSHAAAGVDSSLLFVLATTGLIGLIVYLNILKRIWLISSRSFSQRIILWPTLAGLIIHSFFVNSLFYPFILEWLLVLAGSMAVSYGE